MLFAIRAIGTGSVSHEYLQQGALNLLTWGIGLAITVGLKMLVTTACRSVQYRAYYRIKPASARITSLALECWHIGLAASVLIGRITQFLGASLFWIGRIDVPYLSQDVVLFGYAFDNVPHHFYQDLLIHEAHRHPYIERLSQMYLMKLHHGDKFVSKAGSVWRQLIILSIFPWMAKYRIFTDERLVNAAIDAEEQEEMEERESDPMNGIKDMASEAFEVGNEVATEVVDVGKELYGAGEDVVTEVGRVGKAAISPVGTLVKGYMPSPTHPVQLDTLENANEGSA